MSSQNFDKGSYAQSANLPLPNAINLDATPTIPVLGRLVKRERPSDSAALDELDHHFALETERHVPRHPEHAWDHLDDPDAGPELFAASNQWGQEKARPVRYFVGEYKAGNVVEEEGDAAKAAAWFRREYAGCRGWNEDEYARWQLQRRGLDLERLVF